MQSAQLPPNETERLLALLKYEVLDTSDERAFDELTELAGAICGTSISLISLIDTNRQWFKSRVGLGATETSRELAFCAHAILQEGVFEVTNALEDPRFADNPLVTDDPDIRFYAGAPLMTKEGHALGTLCVIDREPRHLSPKQRKALEVLARQVIGQLDLRLHARRLERIDRVRRQAFGVIAHDLRGPFNGFLGISELLYNNPAGVTGERLKDVAQSMLESATNAYQLLEELLQWYQQQTGGAPSRPQNVSLRELVTKSLSLTSQLASSKGLLLNISVPDSLMAHADTTVVETVLRNLVSNAIKFSPKGGTIEIRASQTQNGGNSAVEVSVSDFGAGMDQATRRNLFKTHVQSALGTQHETGKGFGLKLCADFVAAEGGRIWVDDAYQDGTRIVFTLSPAQLPS